MAEGFKHAATRKAFELAIGGALNHINKTREKGMIQFINLMEKILGKTWDSTAYDALREIYEDPNSKWCKFTNDLFDTVDTSILKSAALNLGFEAGFNGFRKTRKLSEEMNVNIPFALLIDPTSACNLRCTGCWAAEYGYKMNLTNEELDSIVTQAEDLGIHAFLFTGGEPLVRKADLIALAEKHNHSFFQTFTNGTLIDEQFCKDLLRVKNFAPIISLEGFEDQNDDRRGQGVFEKVMHAMDLLKQHKLVFGHSICYTSKNYETVTSDEFLDMVIEKGAKFIWYFHYMPVGKNADTSLLLNPDQREYMFHRVREIRGFKGGKPIFALDFQNDGEWVGGCVAGGREYCHINANGDVEPCVFVHYSNANIRNMSLLDAFKQPIFMKYREGQPFNNNHLRPCPLLENPEILPKLVAETGAKSTDMEAPEDVNDLCMKCDPYAAEWKPRAEKLWGEEMKEREQLRAERKAKAEAKKAKVSA